MLANIVYLIRLSLNPRTIIHPFPLLALLTFSISGYFSIIALLKASLLSFVFYSGVNLWNHVNDTKEDVIAGKKTLLAENKEVRKQAIFLSILFYVLSLVMVIFWTVDQLGLLAYFGAAFSTWIYSDKLFLGKIVKRWKEHYITEVLAYVIFAPSFALLLWSFFLPFSGKSLAFSLLITLFLLAGVFVKDLKDVSSDKLAQLKTLGVVFSQEKLLKVSLTILGLYYLSILLFSYFGLLPLFCVLSVLFSFGLFYVVKHLSGNDWSISLESKKPLKVMVYSNLLSISSLAIFGFTTQIL